MNRDHIDFTKTGKCCLCGAEHNAHFDKAVIRQFGKYTSCRVQICPTCLKLFPGVKRIDNGPWNIASVDDIRLGIDEESVEECWDCLFDVNRLGRRKKILKVRSTEKAVKENNGK